MTGIITAIILSGTMFTPTTDIDCKNVIGLANKTQHNFSVVEIPFKDRRGNRLWLQPSAAESFMDMVEMATAHGYEVKLNSAYRTRAHQMRLWRRMPDIAAHPMTGGKRTHQMGFSVDIAGTERLFTWSYLKKYKSKYGKSIKTGHCRLVDQGYKCPTLLYWWLNRFAARFNFVNDVEGERWHWTYVGEADTYSCHQGYIALENTRAKSIQPK